MSGTHTMRAAEYGAYLLESRQGILQLGVLALLHLAGQLHSRAVAALSISQGLTLCCQVCVESCQLSLLGA